MKGMVISINPKYNKLDSESDFEYGLRLISIKHEDKPDDLDWQDIVEILNLDCHRDSLRKAADTTQYSGYNVMQYFKRKIEEVKISNNSDINLDSDSYMKELEIKLREIEKERIKLQTEKLEYTRWIREDVRDELFEEKVIDSIKKYSSFSNPPKDIPIVHNKKVGLLSLADAHFGKEYKIYGLRDEIINQYSPEIFYSRMEQIYNETLEIVEKENLKVLHIFELGDHVEGFIRNSQLWSLRWGVIDSAVIYGNYMGDWLNKMSENVNVIYHQTEGNHDECRLLDGKKGQHLNESSGKIVKNSILLKNKNNSNFKYVENKTGLIFENIAGYNIMGIHGEVKNLSQAIKDYSDIYDVKISYLIAGHKHHSEFVNCGVRKGCVGVGSLVGSDDFSMTIRKSADATASFLIFEEGKGKVDEHTFVLN